MRVFDWRVHAAIRLAAVAGLVAGHAGCASKKSSDETPTYSYAIVGTVSGDIAAGVTVKILGGSRTVTTDALGRYTFSGLFDGTYTLEASCDGFSFTPPTRTVTVNGASVTDQDFTSLAATSPASISIAGRVTGNGHAGVTVTLAGPAPATTTQTTTTDADGNYHFLNVASGDYLVTPSFAGGWTFSPANALVTMAGASLTGPDFASISPTHDLSGRVTGAFTSGVIVTLSGDADAVAVTDGSGSYAFTGLAPGSYRVTPSYPGYSFAPAERSATIASADVTDQDFVSAATHKIAGRISGDVLAGVEVRLSGSSTGEATTDASGYFEFAGLVSGVYVVTPSLGGYGFGPTQRTVTLSGADFTSADFTASVLASGTYTVSGAVSGAVLAGVTITLQGTSAVTAATDATGAFEFQGVPPGTYLLIAFHDDYTFDPASRLVVVSAADVAGQTFTATVKPTARTISGNVTGAVISGVTVTLMGPSPSTTTQTVTTDGTGSFAFRGVGDGLYLATPSLAGFAFTPADCLVTVAGPSVTNIQFASVYAPHSISGRVSGSVIDGVLVSLSGAGTATTLTASDGSYTFSGLGNGTYQVTPELAGYSFSPVDATVTLAGADATRVDFVSAATHVISGYVSGDVLEGVKITLSGAAGAEATTDVTGHYAFTDLPDGGYVLRASLEGYAFDPQLLPVDLAGADVTTASFTSTLIPIYTVSGTISGPVVDGVSVALWGAATASTTTDGTGAYVFTGLPEGSYMVIPSLGGYAFTPASRAFRINGVDVAGQDFTSAVAP